MIHGEPFGPDTANAPNPADTANAPNHLAMLMVDSRRWLIGNVL